MGRTPGGLAGVEGPRLKGAHQRPPCNWCAFPPINGISCPPAAPPPRRPGRLGAEASVPRDHGCVSAGAAGRLSPFPTEFRAPFGGRVLGVRGRGGGGTQAGPHNF